MKKKYTVTGMTCTACSRGIETTLNKLGGVESAEVSLMGESMTVEFDENVVTESDIAAAVVSLGYGVERYDPNLLKSKKPQADKMKVRFLLSLLFLIPLMYFSMGEMIGLPEPNHIVNYTLQLILTIVIIALNFKFFTSGTKALFRRVPNMDTLVALGSFASFAYSLVLTIFVYTGKMHHAHMFYESAAMILTLVTLGKWLEEKSKRKTGEEVEKLIRLMPDTVTAEKEGKEVLMPFSEIAEGDILVVKQGEYIPVDGKIVFGHAFVDRAAITGESLPVELAEGDAVTGADVVKSGYIKIVAERVGAETTFSKIVKMVKEAGASKAPIQKLADKISGFFVPVVTLLALITFIAWVIPTSDAGKAFNYAISVLVISCPCALGLATPVAVMAATGRGMSLGVLYKDAVALQKAKDVTCVLLDKTATLTVGEPAVTEFMLLKGDRERLLSLAAGIEAHSNHPIAECIKSFALGEENVCELEIENYRYETGKGAIGEYGGKTYCLGNKKLLSNSLFATAEIKEREYAKLGQTLVFLADEEAILALFAVADTLKETSSEAVAAMKERHLRVAMLTGDSENVAKAISEKVGIEEYFAEALPEDKTAAVERVRSTGGNVAMIGDGINDSPALKAADLGVAMGTGTDIAIDSADVVLVGGDLRAVSTMVDLSKAAVKNIKENLFWAFFYNCVAIPVAAGVFAFAGIGLNPMIAAACMSFSSLFVVLNALRLTRFGKKKQKTIQQEAVMQKTLKIKGMMCNHCVMHVTKALEGIEGVEKAEVNLKKKSAVVTLTKEIPDETFRAAIAEAGYEVEQIGD